MVLVAERQDDRQEPQKTDMAAILKKWGFDPDSPGQYERTINKNGILAELRKAKKDFTCKECRGTIEAGTYYYQICYCGSGIDTHPYRVHAEELDKFFSEHDENGYRVTFPWWGNSGYQTPEGNGGGSLEASANRPSLPHPRLQSRIEK